MKVSVWMSAYNHEKYISQCLDSVLNQKTDFDFDIILGEDCSKDRTREIVIDYKNRYPDKFRLYLPEKNIGMMEMDIATWNLCTGEYIALLNGDDFWTDEYKLQTQANFLDNNPDAVMCYHKARVENETTGYVFDTVYPESGGELTAKFLLLGYNPVMTPTVMIRNILTVPDYYRDLPYGDMPLYLLLSQKGKLKYIDKLMSLYRIHPSGQWQGESVYNNLLKDIKFYEIMNEKLNYRYEDLIDKIFSQRYFDLTLHCININDTDKAKEYYSRLLEKNKNFSQIKKEDSDLLEEILFGKTDKSLHQDFLKREVKWKIN